MSDTFCLLDEVPWLSLFPKWDLRCFDILNNSLDPLSLPRHGGFFLRPLPSHPNLLLSFSIRTGRYEFAVDLNCADRRSPWLHISSRRNTPDEFYQLLFSNALYLYFSEYKTSLSRITDKLADHYNQGNYLHYSGTPSHRLPYFPSP